MYINFNKEIKKEGPEFKVSDNVRMSKYKNIFAEGYIPNWSECTVSTLCHGHMLLVITEKKLLERFTKKNYKKQIKRKVIKRKGDNLYVKCKGYVNSFNNWIDKKDIVKMSEYFPKRKSFGERVNVKLDLSIYATKI